jgi:hypothetical protein
LADLPDLADGELADLPDLADGELADLSDLSNLANGQQLTDLTDLSNLADRQQLTDLADLSDLANGELADLSNLTDLSDLPDGELANLTGLTDLQQVVEVVVRLSNRVRRGRRGQGFAEITPRLAGQGKAQCHPRENNAVTDLQPACREKHAA